MIFNTAKAFQGVAAAVALVGVLAGCEAPQRSAPDRDRQHDLGKLVDSETTETAPRPQQRGLFDNRYYPRPGEGFSVSPMAFPTGNVNTSAVHLFQVMPNVVRRGENFTYEYHVHNLTDLTLNNVVVTQESIDNLRVVSSSPAASGGGGGATWALGDLGPGETEVIEVTASASEVGIAANCIAVSYNNALCAATTVIEPALELTKTATDRVIECDTIEYVYAVTNSGTGTAENVVITDTFANGITALTGDRSIRFDIGTLVEGQTREQRVIVKANDTGRFASAASATAAGGASAESGRPSTLVVAPDLAITCESRAEQFLGRNADYTFTVTNNGDGVAANTVVTVNYPGSARYVRSSGGTNSAGMTSFNLGSLAPDETREVTLTLSSSVGGAVDVRASANAACADPVTTSCSTEFKGIPAILLEVIDGPDPVELGTQTVYTITVTNQGTAVDTNVQVVAELPAELTYVSASGATPADVRGRTITFAPVATLAPKAVVTWRITARADAEGDVRFAAELTSDFLTRSVNETEATNLYE